MLRQTRAAIVTAALLMILGGTVTATRLSQGQSRTPDVVYVGTPYDVVSRMLKLAGVTSKDLVYDLGCGDGRMIILAAKKYGCRGIGYDIDPERIRAALENVKRNGVGHLVEVVEADIFTIDISAADVLLLYLHPDMNKRLLPQLGKLKPGSRMVFHEYGLPEMEADDVIKVTSNEDNVTHTLYLYTTPLKPAKTGSGGGPASADSNPGKRT